MAMGVRFCCDSCCAMKHEPSPVFIIGGSRTGSEMLKTMLSASEWLDFVDEMFVLTPIWLHTDLKTNLRRRFGSLTQADTDDLIEYLYSGELEGWFWTAIESKLDKSALRDELAKSDLSLRSIFAAVMKVHARKARKKGLGAKFPVHYGYAQKLLEWFPDCRLIHTTRNPKAVYASQAVKYTKDISNKFAEGFIRFKHFAHINIQVSWTAHMHRQLRSLPNYRLVRYENIVADPEKELRSICNFLEVEYTDSMLRQHQYGSSFDTIGSGVGVSTSSLQRWRSTMSPMTASMMDVMHRGAYKALGYSTR